MSGINPAGYVTKPVCEHLQQMEDIAAHAKKKQRVCAGGFGVPSKDWK